MAPVRKHKLEHHLLWHSVRCGVGEWDADDVNADDDDDAAVRDERPQDKAIAVMGL